MSWHYFSTSHYKGVVDGIGGVVKRFVYPSILSGQQCQSATDLVTIAQSKTNTIEFFEIEQYHIDNSIVLMEQIFQLVKPVPEMKKIHSPRVLKNNSIEYEYYSKSSTKKIFKFHV